MAHKVKASEKTSVRTGAFEVRGNDADALAAEYLALRDDEKRIKERKSEIQAIVRPLMNEGKLATKHGIFAIEPRTTLSWSLEVVRMLFGKSWPSFVKVDNAAVAARASSVPELS